MSKSFEPAFTISVQAADSLAKIVESVTRLDLGTDYRLDVRLHRENRVRSIYSSLAIEGNMLSLPEVADVLQGKAVWGRPRDIQEVKNAHEAYEQLRSFDPYQARDFLAAHRLITQGLIGEAGTFRSGDVAVYSDDVPVHIGARPQFVPDLVDELFGWARDSELHPVLLSAIVHCEIETIHPFADGNGRIGRLWQTLILSRWNEAFASLPMESVVFENRPRYYEALRASQRTSDATSFIEFSLGAILDTIESVLVQYEKSTESSARTSSGRINGRISGRINEDVLALLRRDPSLTTPQLAVQLGKGERTVRRALATLQAAGRLRREGSKKTGRWIVNEETL
ncbi:Fic family protein [Actinomycetaceae bacterium L2_0104]